MKMEKKLEERIEEIISRYEIEGKIENIRKGLRIFTKITKLKEEKVREYIENKRRSENKDKYSGLALSVYMKK